MQNSKTRLDLRICLLTYFGYAVHQTGTRVTRVARTCYPCITRSHWLLLLGLYRSDDFDNLPVLPRSAKRGTLKSQVRNCWKLTSGTEQLTRGQPRDNHLRFPIPFLRNRLLVLPSFRSFTLYPISRGHWRNRKDPRSPVALPPLPVPVAYNQVLSSWRLFALWYPVF